jgi:hypothetical protein
MVGDFDRPFPLYLAAFDQACGSSEKVVKDERSVVGLAANDALLEGSEAFFYVLKLADD